MPASYVVQQGRRKKKKRVKHAPSSVCARSVLNGEQVGRCRDVGWEEKEEGKKKPSDNWGGSRSGHVTPWSCACGQEVLHEHTCVDLLCPVTSREKVWEISIRPWADHTSESECPQHTCPRQGLSLPTPAAEVGQGLTRSHTHRMYTAALAAWWSRERADRGRNGARLAYSRSALLTMIHCRLMRWSKAWVWPGVPAMYSDRKTC